MFAALKIQKHFPRRGVLFRLFHGTNAIQANMLENIRNKEREVDPLPPTFKKKMEPYVKNLCYGKVDPNVLAFPEFDLGRLNIVEEMSSELKKFLNTLYSSETPNDLKIPEVLSKLKETGIFGVNIPRRFQGGELSCMEINRLGETLASDLSLFQTLNVHISTISQLFSNYASDQQKERYLPLLASGELQCGVAIWEKNAGLDFEQFECVARPVGDKYNLSGTKLWVSNFGFANKVLVFARVINSSKGEEESSVSCFLVDKHSPGIISKKMETVGLNGFEVWEVNFDRTPVPLDNMIGECGGGLEMLMNIINSKSTIIGAAYASVLRRMLEITVHHVTFKEVYGKPLKDYEIVQQHLCEVSALIYTLESISYLTANFFDDYEDPDCEVEVAIVNLFATNALTKGFDICASLLGSQVYVKGSQWSRMLHDVQFMTTVEHSRDVLRLLISKLCVTHVGKNFGTYLKQLRNPFYHPEVIMKYMLKTGHTDVPMIDKIVPYHLHPNLAAAAEDLEVCISHLNHVVIELLMKWGTEIMEKHADLVRIADIAVECFCVTAVLGRTSRSMCIGLPNSDIDFELSKKIAHDASLRVIQASQSALDSPYLNFDKCLPHITEMLMKGKSYGLSHPLSRNY